MVKHFRHTRLLLAGAAFAVLAAFPRVAEAQLSPIIPSINSLTNTVSWNSVVDPSSSTAVVTYTLYSRPGINFVDPQDVILGSHVNTVFTSFAYGGRMATSQCFQVTATDVVSGLFDTSAIVCHSYLHNPAYGNTGGPTLADGQGTQLGFDQTWTLGYALDAASDVLLEIYPPGSVFGTNANNFRTPPVGVSPTAIVVGNVPRPGEDGNTQPINLDTWDSRNSSGTLVPNGLYLAYFSVTDAFGTVQYEDLSVIPVDIIRFTAFSTTGLSPTAPLGDINYTITANANVRVLIAKPGSQFTIDSSSNVQALNSLGQIDTTTNTVIAVITGQRNAGANTETWNGTNSLGVAVATGVYAVGMSATDASGNPALNLSGNNGPLAGSIALDRVPSQSAQGGTAPSVSSISIGGAPVNLSGGTSVGAFSTINITLNATGGPATTVALTGPSGLIAGGNVVVAGTAVTYSTTAVLSTTGSYTVSIQPYDLSGTVPGPVQNTPFAVIAGVGPSVTGISIGGTTLTLTGGTSVGSFSAISITLSGAGSAATGVSLTGPLGIVTGATVTVSGTAVTWTNVTVATTGAYSLTINPIGSTGNIGPVQTTAFTVTAGSSGGGAVPGATNASFAPSFITFPNPVKNIPSTFQFLLAAPSTVTFDIYTLTGQHVLHQSSVYAAAGTNSFPWGLNNDSGNIVASGVYILHASVSNALGTAKVSKKIMVIK